MNYVIGDIHGEETKLKLLLKNILAIDKNPSLIFIGDYINKGENSYQTLQYLTDLSNQYNCIFLRGNHEYYWELLESNSDQYAGQLIKYGGLNTVHSINKDGSFLETKTKLFTEFKSIFSSLKNYHQQGNYIITHSGIPPEFYNTAIENVPVEKLLFNRYDFIKHPSKYFEKTVIFGHTGFYSPFYDGKKIGIDTAACYLKEQPLTAFCLDGDFFIDSHNKTTQLSAINQAICPAIPRVKAWQQL